jgi:hypothetical protein
MVLPGGDMHPTLREVRKLKQEAVGLGWSNCIAYAADGHPSRQEKINP